MKQFVAAVVFVIAMMWIPFFTAHKEAGSLIIAIAVALVALRIVQKTSWSNRAQEIAS